MQVIQYFLFHQQTPLHLAAERGRFENTLKYLVDKGADINIKENYGVSIILLTQHYCESTIHQYLLIESREGTIHQYLLIERRVCQPSMFVVVVFNSTAVVLE